MSGDEAIDIAVAVANALRIYFWGNCRNLENLIKIIVTTAVLMYLTNYESSCVYDSNLT